MQSMEVNIMTKQERLDRMRRRALVWETSKICLDLVKEMVEGVGRASTMSMMSAVVGKMVERAEATGHLNNIITEIISQGQEVRDKVERRLRSAIAGGAYHADNDC